MLDEAILLAATRADVLSQRLKRSRGSSGVPLRTEEAYALLMACSDYERLLDKELMPLRATWSRTGPGDVRPHQPGDRRPAAPVDLDGAPDGPGGHRPADGGGGRAAGVSGGDQAEDR
ncbi:hypothetical protein ACH0AC_00205 [Micrococcus luteus]|uniref:hypothetical protein n=1 Tax=Micrococcus luteus TaxID=1270 RepID=UPI003879C91E